MSIIGNHINLVYNNEDLKKVLYNALSNIIKIKYAIINKEFDNIELVKKYFPNIIFKYIEDIDMLYNINKLFNNIQKIENKI